MKNATLHDIARHFHVSDIPEAMFPGTRLSNILDNMYHGRALGSLALDFLQKYPALQQLASGQITYEAYRVVADQAVFVREQAKAAKLQTRELARLASEAAQTAREAEWAAKHKRDRDAAIAAQKALERDPKYIAKMKSRALRKKFGLEFIEEPLFRKMMNILLHLDSGQRLADIDLVWLKTEAKEHFTDEIRRTYHLLEAEFFTKEYRSSHDSWNAINASSHYRKCDRARVALELLETVPIARLKDAKTRSALCTTRGGVMRDLCRPDEALVLGAEAHELTPNDYRPCTLLGAVNMEEGNYSEGIDWYDKAEARGATRQAVDSDIRRIFYRADKIKREELKTFLLAEDQDRYRWVIELK